MDPDTTKRCTKCGEEKDYSDFYANGRYSDGRDCWCVECRRSYAKAYVPPKTTDEDPDDPILRRRKYFRDRQRLFRERRKTADA